MSRGADRSCRGKKPYTEPAAGAKAATKRAAGITLTAYRCPYCHAWHVGHPPIRIQLRIITAGKRLTPRRRK